MNKKLLYTSLLLATIITGCKKNNDAPAGYHITLVTGGGQSDTVAHLLKMPVVLMATFNGQAMRNGYIKTITFNCDNDPVATLFDLRNSAYYDNPGKIIYQWQLNGSVGKQTARILLLDSMQVAHDSIEVSATAASAAKGWNTSGCIPTTTFSNTFCKLPSGRILMGLRRADYPYYSDDNGASWHTLKTFPNVYSITKLIATPANEVFLAVYGVGMYYSPDSGSSWEKRSNGLPGANFWAEIQYTASGHLFVLTGNGIFTSPDKGLNWHQVTYGLSYYAGFSDAASTSDGTIYAVHSNQLLVYTDNGEGWRPVYSISGSSSAGCLFIDDNDDIYYGAYNGAYGVSLYVSKDKTQTWQPVYTSNAPAGVQPSIKLLSKQGGNYYFYSSDQNILMKTSDFVKFSVVNPSIPTNNGRNSFRYIIADNGEAVMSTEFFGIQYFLK